MRSPRRVVVVTGAAGGLGRAIARRLGAEAGTALLLCDIDAHTLGEVAAALECDGVPVHVAAADVGDRDAVAGLVEEAVGRFGSVEVMINNAGVLSPNARIHNLAPEDWERALRVNLMGAVHGIEAVVPVMRRQGGGSIISTGSVAGLTAWTHSAPYGAAKAAVIHLTRMAALEYAPDAIRVNCVCPGSFASGMQRELPAGALETVARRHPLGLGSPDDLVGAYAYLAGPESRWTTGAALVVDGGYALP